MEDELAVDIGSVLADFWLGVLLMEARLMVPGRSVIILDWIPPTCIDACGSTLIVGDVSKMTFDQDKYGLYSCMK